jgi:hypothetical protein
MWMKLHVVAFVLRSNQTIAMDVGRCLPHVWGYMKEERGCVGEECQADKDPADRRADKEMSVYQQG